MQPEEVLLIETTTNLDGILLILAMISFIIFAYNLLCLALDQKRMKKYKKIRTLIEQGRQNADIHKKFHKK